MHREILDEYLSQLEILTEKIERFQNRLEELSQKETYRDKIGQLRCIKGIDTTVAVTIHAETSDFDRFPNAKVFASYCGLTPSEDSSGDKIRRLGITKQGNSMIRTALVEAAQVLVRGVIGKKGKKYHCMILRGVSRNIAITAIARELSCFVWGIETVHLDFFINRFKKILRKEK